MGPHSYGLPFLWAPIHMGSHLRGVHFSRWGLALEEEPAQAGVNRNVSYIPGDSVNFVAVNELHRSATSFARGLGAWQLKLHLPSSREATGGGPPTCVGFTSHGGVLLPNGSPRRWTS
jgi:hypothetical protein